MHDVANAGFTDGRDMLAGFSLRPEFGAVMGVGSAC
jgi:hypothetical protein